MPLTLNQVVKRLEKLALAHKQINHFYVGDAAEWLANGEVNYPACFVDFTTGSISKDERHTGWDFNIWFADLANVATDSRTNELEVESDLTSIAIDFKSMLHYTGYQNDWDIGESSQLEYFKEKFEDIVIAVRMSQRIDSITPMDRCVVPSDFTFEIN